MYCELVYLHWKIGTDVVVSILPTSIFVISTTWQEAVKAREALREQVAALAVKGAEQILRRDVDVRVHSELLSRLKAEL